MKVFIASMVLTISVTAAQTGRFVDVNGTRLYYEVEGTGEPLVLIHGWSLNLRMFDPQLPDFARRYQVIRIDRRGFGKSAGDEDTTWDVDDLRQLLDSLGVKSAHILGMSGGARVALTFAVRYPERVRSLILHGPSAPNGFGLPFNGSDRLNTAEFEAIARAQGIDAARRRWSAHPLLDVPSRNVAARKQMDALLADYRGGRWLKTPALSGPDQPATMSDLASLKVPTLVLVGDREVPYLRIVADALTYGIAGATKVVIPGGGHMINIIEPARYNRAVLRFLSGVSK